MKELDLASRQHRHSHLLQLIEQLKEQYTPHQLLHLACTCLSFPCCAYPPAARAAFSAALERMNRGDEPPCMDLLAEVIILPVLDISLTFRMQLCL